MAMTQTEARRLGKYHHGRQTAVMGVRLPVEMKKQVAKMAENFGMTTSEYMEFIIETQILRKR
jgi:predicted DNA-binding protein